MIAIAPSISGGEESVGLSLYMEPPLALHRIERLPCESIDVRLAGKGEQRERNEAEQGD